MNANCSGDLHRRVALFMHRRFLEGRVRAARRRQGLREFASQLGLRVAAEFDEHYDVSAPREYLLRAVELAGIPYVLTTSLRDLGASEAEVEEQRRLLSRFGAQLLLMPLNGTSTLTAVHTPQSPRNAP